MKKLYVLLALALAAALLAPPALRWARRGGKPAPAAAQQQRWQCPMHPEIVRAEPGDCPICHMRLQLVAEAPAASPAASPGPAAGPPPPPGRAAFRLGPGRRQLIGVRSQPLGSGEVVATLRLPGHLGSQPGQVEAQALEMDGAVLKPGLEASVSVDGQPPRPARLLAVSGGLDAYSRTFAVRLALSPAAFKPWRPGLYCTVRVPITLARGLVLPKEAVFDTGERQWVFVEVEEGRFEPRAVQLGREGDSLVELRQGLEAGERVVTSANFFIDSESRFRAAAQKQK